MTTSRLRNLGRDFHRSGGEHSPALAWVSLSMFVLVASAPQGRAQNLVVNGDFEMPSAVPFGFFTQYVNAAPSAPGRYYILSNPSAWNAGFPACVDHTTCPPSGRMMLVDGSDASPPQTIVWGTTLDLEPNSAYQLRFWYLTLNAVEPAGILVRIQQTNPPMDLIDFPQFNFVNNVDCTWREAVFPVWYNNNVTQINIYLVDRENSDNGNDFALDDISFTRFGRCCVGQTCSITSEADCLSQDGVYGGHGTSCPLGPPETYSSVVGGRDIPDNDPVGLPDTISPPDTFEVGDVNVELDITHAWVGDLCITVEHNATSAMIVARIGANTGVPCHTNGPFGCNNNDLVITLDDEGAAPVETGCDAGGTAAPFPAGVYIPFAALSVFDGMSVNDAWNITVADRAGGIVGAFNSWSIIVEPACPPPEVPPLPPPNDECAGAIPLSVGETVTGSTHMATEDPDAPMPCNSMIATGPGVWYTLVGTGDVIALWMCALDEYDSALAVYEGPCDVLTCVAGDDDGCGPLGPARVTFSSVSGVTYRILVTGKCPATGDFVLETGNEPLGATNNLVVSSTIENSVFEYHWPSGIDLGRLVVAGSGGLNNPHMLRFGPNRNLFVVSRFTNSLIQYNGTTGALIGAFVPSGSGGLLNPSGLAWAPNGNVLLSSALPDFTAPCMTRFDGTTGAPIGNFACFPESPCCSLINMAFRPNGNVLLSFTLANVVREYTFPAGVLVKTYSGGLDGPRGMTIRPNGNLLVCSVNNHKVVQFNTTTGALIGDFVTQSFGQPSYPTDLAYGPNGNLFVTSWGTGSILEYDGATGAPIGIFAQSNKPWGLAFRPAPAPALPGDLGDGLVDGNDIQAFITCLVTGTATGGCAAADMDTDGDVDDADKAIFVARLLT